MCVFNNVHRAVPMHIQHYCLAWIWLLDPVLAVDDAGAVDDPGAGTAGCVLVVDGAGAGCVLVVDGAGIE